MLERYQHFRLPPIGATTVRRGSEDRAFVVPEAIGLWLSSALVSERYLPCLRRGEWAHTRMRTTDERRV